MKNLNTIFSVLLMLITSSLVNAQSWTVYNADVDPLSFDPVFEVTQQSGAFTNQIVVDPENAGNNLLQMTTATIADNNQWRQPTTAENLTIVIKAKSLDAANKNLLFDMDMRNSTAGRFSLRVLTDGTYSIASGGSGSEVLGHNASEWTIYRFTKSGQDVNVYLDEDPTPVATFTSTSTSDGSDYFRFGDGWGSGNIDTQIDWVTWDLTGAYSPADQALPSELVTPVANWTVYNADVDPLSFDPPFEVTQQTNAINQIIADPDNPDNSLLQMTTAVVGDNNQWRQPTTAENLTIVIKAKSLDVANKNLLFDMDMRNTTAGRFSLRVLTDGTYSIASGGSGSEVLGHNASEWTIYRFTKSGQDVNVYLDEDPTPVATFTSTSTTDGSDYFRFGDGWGSGNIDTQIDWVTWELSGAYSPSELALPDELTKIPVGDWTVYEADVDPLLFDPAFEVTQQSGSFTNQIIADLERPGNNLLQMRTTDITDNNQWRQPTTAENLTIVVKAKSLDPSTKNLLFDMDMRNTTAGRFSLRVLTDGTYSIASGGSGSEVLGHNAAEWTIYRFTKSGQDIAVYLDEDPTPVVTFTSTSTTDGSDYFRFGDGWGSGNIDTQFDWVAWDFTGAYAPSQSRLPDNLLQAPLGDWTVYEADVDPLSFDPAFEVTQQSGAFTNQIVVDPEDAGNNLLQMTTTDITDNNQWRQPTTAENLTIVVKAKSLDVANKNLLFDMDMRNSTAGRFSLRVLTDGTYSIASGGSGSEVLGHNASEWTIYRFTKSGQDVKVYLDEDPTPVATFTSTSTTDGSDYFRFGDGWGSGNIDTQIDWAVWDLTGAYSPYARRLPDELTGAAPEVPVPTLKTLGSVAALSQDLGLATDLTIGTYKLSGTDLTDNITVTPPVNFEVSVDTINWYTNANPLAIAHTDGIVEDTVLIVRLNAIAVGEYSGDISNTSEGAEEELVSVSGTTIDLIPEITLTGTLEKFVQNISTPSSSQNYRVSGVNLKDSLTVTAPAGYEVSADDVAWGTSFRIGATDRTITNAFVYVRQFASAIGSISDSISHTSTDATEVKMAVTGEVISDPGITIEGDFTDFSQSLGTPSAAQSYTISGSSLTSNIDISLPDDFEISIDENIWLKSLTLVPLDGIVETMILFVRLNATAKGTYSGNIVHSSVGVDDVAKAVSGTTDDTVLAILGPDDIAFAIWPNPSSDKITIQRENELGEAKVSVYSLQGNLISQYAVGFGSKLLELDIRGLESGVYIVGYQGDGKVITQRLIKK